MKRAMARNFSWNAAQRARALQELVGTTEVARAFSRRLARHFRAPLADQKLSFCEWHRYDNFQRAPIS
jgi:hypothetical protein